jgi:hypothetical protein
MTDQHATTNPCGLPENVLVPSDDEDAAYWNDPFAPRNAYPLFQLWKKFGLTVGLFKSEWDELKPVLDRQPALKLINPLLDKAAAEEVFEEHFRRHGERPRPVTWFQDAKTARDYHSLMPEFALPAFPSINLRPQAFATAWLAGDLLGNTDGAKWTYEERIQAELSRRKDEQKWVREIRSLASLLELFAAGVFYYWILPEEVICVSRPSLWVVDGLLHRADGPAVEWPTAERYYFWQQVEVPKWIIENPEEITPERIRAEPDAEQRRCMMERFGMERFTILERWAEWQYCHHPSDYRAFVDSGIQHSFNVVSQRITIYADAAADRLTRLHFQKPDIDKRLVAAALRRFLGEWGEPERPLRWFEDGRSAREYVQQISSERPRAAYWPRSQIAPVLDAAWYRDEPNSALRHNARWLQLLEDWQDWTITWPRALDCNDVNLVTKRCERMEYWVVAIHGRNAPPSAAAVHAMSLSEPAVRRWTPLVDAFEAGLFYYWIGPEEIVCIPRPSLWIADNRLHREHGPAVEWPTGECYYFWRGVEVPHWVIEQPDRITSASIRAERNVEIRRCMIERIGVERFLHECGATLVAHDHCGALWHVSLDRWGRETRQAVVEVENGTREPDGTRRKYFLPVPPSMQSPREAVAWTYGLSTEQYEIAVRT